MPPNPPEYLPIQRSVASHRVYWAQLSDYLDTFYRGANGIQAPRRLEVSLSFRITGTNMPVELLPLIRWCAKRPTAYITFESSGRYFHECAVLNQVVNHKDEAWINAVIHKLCSVNSSAARYLLETCESGTCMDQLQNGDLVPTGVMLL
jgi:hypothetical protein